MYDNSTRAQKMIIFKFFIYINILSTFLLISLLIVKFSNHIKKNYCHLNNNN